MNIDPREWDLQECALREDAAYREVAQALLRSPGEPPADFAASVAALAASTPATTSTRAWTPDVREGFLERWLLRAFAAVLGIAFVGAIVRYDGAWRDGFTAIAAIVGDATALNWALAAGACLAMSWGFGRLPGRGAGVR